MRLPNFLIIGHGRCGTTSLSNYLSQHPEIFISRIKEPRFFMYEGVESDDIKGKRRWKDNTIRNLYDYSGLFDDVTTEKVWGEASVEYFMNQQARHNIKKLVPNAKIILGLRNPVERVYSHYVFCLREGIEDVTNFPKAIKRNRNSYIDGGFYYDHTRRWLEAFPEDRIFIYLFDDFKENTLKIVTDIFSFLNVSPNFSPNLSKKHNVGKIRLEKKPMGLLKFLYEKSFIIKKLSQHSLISVMNKHFPKNNPFWYEFTPGFDEKTRNSLKNLYRSDIIKLEKLIKRDLSAWL